MRPFEGDDKKFQAGTEFPDLVKLYEFDRDLRLLCLDAIERIEVALRANLVNVLAEEGGPHFFNDESYFERHDSLSTIQRISENGKHLSIEHYKKTYKRPFLPPIWCLTEASTFGQISKIFAGLKLEHRKNISQYFELDEKICTSWFRCLTALRNICAHHGRLWNAQLVVDCPKKAKKYKYHLYDNESFYSRLVIIRALLKKIDLNNGGLWCNDLKCLLKKIPRDEYISIMGFPDNWKNDCMWK